MRRKITNDDKKILVKNAGWLRESVTGSSSLLSFPLIAVAFTAGGIAGAVVAFAVLGKDHPLCEVSLFGVCIAVTLGIIALGLWIKKQLFISKYIRTGKTEINGGVVSFNNEQQCFEYIEDDNVDENGAPYMIRIPKRMVAIKPGERVLLLINGDNISIVRLNDGLVNLVQDGMDGGWQAAADSRHIGHQKQLKNEDYSVKDSDIRIKRFFSVYKNGPHYPKSSIITGAVFGGFLIATLLVFAGYGFIFQYIPPIEKNYFAFGLPLIGILTVASGVVAGNIYSARLRKKYQDLNGVSKVILLSVTDHMMQDIKTFTVVEKDPAGNQVTGTHAVNGNYDVRDVAKMQSGQTIYKYTYGNNGVFFGTK